MSEPTDTPVAPALVSAPDPQQPPPAPVAPALVSTPDPQQMTPEEQAVQEYKRRTSKLLPSPAVEQYRQQRALEQSGLEADQENDGRPSDWTLMRPDVGEKLGNAMARGGMNAWNGILRFGAQVLGKATLGRSWSNTDAKDLDKQFAMPVSQQDWDVINPFTGKRAGVATFSASVMDGLAGPAQSGIFGIVESLTEFGIEMFAAGKLLRVGLRAPSAVAVAGNAVARGTFVAEAANAVAGFSARALSSIEKVGVMKGAMQGAIKAAAFDDPYAERLSSFVAEAPPEISRAIDKYTLGLASGAANTLKPDATDDYGKAQLKNVLEDYLLGVPFAVAGLMFGATIKGVRKGLTDKKITQTEAEMLLKAAREEYANAIELGAKSKGLDGSADDAAKAASADLGIDAAAKDAAAVADSMLPADDVAKAASSALGIDAAAKDAATVADSMLGPTYVKQTPDGMWRVFRRELDTGVEQVDDEATKALRAESGSGKKPYGAPETRAIPVLDRTPDQKILQVETAANRMDAEQQRRSADAFLEAKRGEVPEVPEKAPTSGELTNAGPGRQRANTASEPVPVASEPTNGARPANVKPTTTKIADVPGPQFKTKTEAEFASGAIDAHFAAAKAAKEPVTKEVMVSIRKRFKEIYDSGDSPDPRQLADVLEEYGVNAKFLQGADDSIAFIKSMVDELPDASKAGRRKPTTVAAVMDRAKELFGKNIDVVKLEDRLTKLGFELHDAPAVMTAGKAVMVLQHRQVKKLSALMDAHPGNEAVEDMLLKSLQNLHEIHTKFTSNNADVARTLQIPNQRTSDELASAFSLGGAARSVDERAAAKGTGDDAAKEATEGLALAERKAALEEQIKTLRADIGSLKGTAKEATEGLSLAERKAALEEQLKTLSADTGSLKGTETAATEGLSLAERKAALEERIETLGAGIFGRKVERALKSGGNKLARQEALDLARMITMSGDEDIDAILKVIAGPTLKDIAKANPELKQSLTQRFLGARVEMILSGLDTQMANILSGMHRLVSNPAEFVWYGVTRADSELLKDGWELTAGQMMAGWDAVSFAGKSFRLGRSIIDPGKTFKADARGAELLPLSQDMGAWGAVKSLFRYSSRTLMASDEFFSQIHYRAKARMDIARHLRQRVDEGTVAPTEIKATAERMLKASVDEGTGRGIYKAARDYAADATYRTDLSGTAEAFQKFVNSNPVTQFFFPFVRAPANIFDFAWQSTPGLNLLNKNFQEAMAKGGEDAARATARAEFGTMMYGVAGYLAASGSITGKGPTDPKLRAEWQKRGYQPYTLTIAGQRFSYRRADPYFASLGVMADFWTASGDIDEGDRYSLAAALAASFAANATNKSYMSNVDTLLQALSGDDPRKMEKLLGSAAHSSLVPAVVHDLNQDPYERETQSILDMVLARTPGFSETLEPRMNIFGEPVLRPAGFANRLFNPLTHFGPITDDYAASELIKLGRALPDLPMKLDGLDIDLTNRTYFSEGREDRKSPRTRWYELMGEVRDSGGQNLKDKLTTLMQGEQWKKMTNDDAYAEGGHKFMVASAIILGYREAAKAKLLTEYPLLMQAFKDEQEVKAAGIMGGKAAANIKSRELRALNRLLHRYQK